jgi:hypothetical protein
VCGADNAADDGAHYMRQRRRGLLRGGHDDDAADALRLSLPPHIHRSMGARCRRSQQHRHPPYPPPSPVEWLVGAWPGAR